MSLRVPVDDQRCVANSAKGRRCRNSRFHRTSVFCAIHFAGHARAR